MPEDVLTIADAKRGDIGNTARQYARAFFEQMDFDAVTLSPYMGRDAIQPFLTYESKWAVILALTSNEGAHDFQMLEADGKPLYTHVIEKSRQWGNTGNTMFVVGGTHAGMLSNIREQCPEHFLLIPGIGRQGGEWTKVATDGLNADYGLLANVARSIIYAGSGKDFQQQVKAQARDYQEKMRAFI